MKKALPVVAFACVLMVRFVSAVGDQTLYGYVSCSKCEPAKATTQSHRECMEKCVAQGANVVLVSDNDHTVIGIENPSSLSGHHAHHVAVHGYMSGNVFHVMSVRII